MLQQAPIPKPWPRLAAPQASLLRQHSGFWSGTIREHLSYEDCSRRGVAAIGRNISGQFFKSIEHPRALLCEAEIVFEKHACGYAAKEIEASHRRYTGDSRGLPLREQQTGSRECAFRA